VDANEALAERFEEHRIRLRSVAYRMLGSLSEADDAVQEAWLRLSGAEAKDIENLGGWLTTAVARVCRNMLRSRRTRCRRRNAWRSCCTTCSRCPSTRSDRWWGASRRPEAAT
jgi:DNA-directed RNA polymerase specialized sigma24 family protein